jgi:hypothetical protein
VHRILKIALASVLVLFLLPAPLGAVRDAGTTQIIFPNGEVFYRQWMLPLNVQAQAVVKNFGDSAASFQVQLRIDTAPVETSQVTDLPPQESALVQFPVTLPEFGTHSIACSTALAGDVQPANDRTVTSFETFESHLAVRIPASCTTRIGDTLIFWAVATNNGTRLEGGAFLLTISRLADSMVVYEDVESVWVLPTQSALLTFAPWGLDSVGVYKCLLRIGRMPLPLLDTFSWFVTVLGSGVEEGDKPQATSLNSQATVVRGVLEMPEAASCKPQAASWLLDATGRRVAELHPGPNDVSRLGAGVFFVRSGPSAASREPSAVHRVVIAR